KQTVVNTNLDQAVVVEFGAMLEIGGTLPGQLPQQHEIGDRRECRQENLEEPNLGKCDKPQRAVAAVEGKAAVFPQALQCAVRPAEALTRQTPECRRRFGPCDGR